MNWKKKTKIKMLGLERQEAPLWVSQVFLPRQSEFIKDDMKVHHQGPMLEKRQRPARQGFQEQSFSLVFTRLDANLEAETEGS